MLTSAAKRIIKVFDGSIQRKNIPRMRDQVANRSPLSNDGPYLAAIRFQIRGIWARIVGIFSTDATLLVAICCEISLRESERSIRLGFLPCNARIIPIQSPISNTINPIKYAIFEREKSNISIEPKLCEKIVPMISMIKRNWISVATLA